MIAAVLLWGLVVVRSLLGRGSSSVAWQNAFTMFLATTTQALPFLVFGVALSGAIAAFVPPTWVARVFGSSPLSVPVAATCGALLPGCECSSVPVAARLMRTGGSVGPSLAFLLASPAINPVVLVSTAVAFPGRPEVVVARAGASWLVAVIVGLVWRGQPQPDLRVEPHDHQPHESKLAVFVSVVNGDFVYAGGFLVVGALATTAMRTIVPVGWVDGAALHTITSIAVMAFLAVVLSVCSEADAFLATAMGQFSLASRLVFLTVGPMVDIKLILQQRAAFGARFTRRFVPLTLICAVVVATMIGEVLL